MKTNGFFAASIRIPSRPFEGEIIDSEALPKEVLNTK